MALVIIIRTLDISNSLQTILIMFRESLLIANFTFSLNTCLDVTTVFIYFISRIWCPTCWWGVWIWRSVVGIHIGKMGNGVFWWSDKSNLCCRVLIIRSTLVRVFFITIKLLLVHMFCISSYKLIYM